MKGIGPWNRRGAAPQAVKRIGAAWAATVVIGLATLGGSMAQAAPSTPAQLSAGVIRQFEFRRAEGIKIPVLRPELFQQMFGSDAQMPKTDLGVRQLAHRIYSLARIGQAPEPEECGEEDMGRLYAALQNPEISDEARDAVDAEADAATPALPKTYTSGHFRFFYTDNDANATNNVTLAQIQATATVLNAAWDDYTAHFREPKHYLAIEWKSFFPPILDLVDRVDVKVYDLGPGLLGQTASGWDYIELDSSKCVANACKRQTTPVHELFHRVQYAYGYVSGTAGMKWAVEATAAWSQKYRAPGIGDWMQRMNSGLAAPQTALTDRSYDACHFWVYLGEQGGSEWQTIRDVWATYEANGKNMLNAVESVIHSRIGGVYSRDAVVGWWSFANFVKDLTNANSWQDYAEDDLTEGCGGSIYGPLTSVPATTVTLNGYQSNTFNDSVGAYGARYYAFNIGSLTRKVKIDFTGGSANFGLAIIEIKGDHYVTYLRSPAGGWSSYSYEKSLSSSQVDRVVVVVIGNPGGGNYSVKATSSGLWLWPIDIVKIKVPMLP